MDTSPPLLDPPPPPMEVDSNVTPAEPQVDEQPNETHSEQPNQEKQKSSRRKVSPELKAEWRRLSFEKCLTYQEMC